LLGEKALLLLLTIILSIAKDKEGYAKNNADKEYYLLDSLDLYDLTEYDKGFMAKPFKELLISITSNN
jgi:hypothetical protein